MQDGTKIGLPWRLWDNNNISGTAVLLRRGVYTMRIATLQIDKY